MSMRGAANAGAFYPADPGAMRGALDQHLDAARACPGNPVALVAPHAGWGYCGAVMGTAFAGLRDHAVRRVIHLGPSHHHAITGIVSSGAASFDTPTGPVPVTPVDHPAITADPKSHTPEHALEVQLPFLQAMLGRFDYIPLLVGECAPETVADVLGALGAASPDVLTIVSSDLSHGLPPAAARDADLVTLRAVEALDTHLSTAQACGASALNGLATFAARQGWNAMALDRRDGTGTAGIHSETTVGYAAIAYYRS